MKIQMFALFILCSMLHGQEPHQTKTLESIKDKTSITYKIVHPLHEIEATSNDVTARIEVNESAKQIKSVSAQVDVTTFNSGNSNRDSHAMEVIDALTYPEANFTSTAVNQSHDSLTVTGKLFFHGVTKDVTIAALSNWSNDTLKIQGTFTTTLTEFNIERPSLLMIPVKDSLWFTLSAVFKVH